MDVVDLINFLGHSSIHKPFDEYMTYLGLKKRPKIGKSLDTIIPIKAKGLSISFEIDAEGEGIVQRSEGTFVFYLLEIMLLEKFQSNGVYVAPCHTVLAPQILASTSRRNSKI
jgi:hypothetical protein